MNLAERLYGLAERHRWLSLPAYHVGDRTWTHEEIHATAARMATVLAARGVRRGDRVLLALPDDAGLIVVFLALARLGAVAVLVNPLLTAGDHGYLREDSGARLAVVAEFGPPLGHATRIEDLLRDAATASSEHLAAPCPDNEPLYLQYTSGTTGRPKGVLHRHGDVEHYHAAGGRAVFRPGPRDVLLSISKLYFTFGFDNSFAYPLFSGASAVLLPQPFDPGATAAAVRRHGVTVLFTVPNASARLLAETSPEAYTTVRAAVSAGEMLTAELSGRLADHVGAPVLDQIGATEAGQAFCSNTLLANAPGTLGRPLPGFTLQVRHRTGRPARDGEPGELWIRGSTLAHGYLNKPEPTAAAFQDGWFNTHDLATRNTDGTYTHHGRTDDIEVVSGINISPHEVERVLAELPSVREVAVAAVHDAHGASRLVAFVVPALEVAPGALERQVHDHAAERLAAFKVPKETRTVAELPRTPSGKLRRFVLRGEATR